MYFNMVSIVGLEPTVCNGFDEFYLIGGFKRPAAVCVYLYRYYKHHIEIHYRDLRPTRHFPPVPLSPR